MKLKSKIIAALVAVAASASAHADMENFLSGNSSLAFIALDNTGSPVSTVMDLSFNLSDFVPTSALSTNPLGTTIVWNFNTNALSVNGVTQAGTNNWSSAYASFAAVANAPEVKWGVIAGDADSVGEVGDLRYMSTSNNTLAQVQSTPESNLFNFAGVDALMNGANGLMTDGITGGGTTTIITNAGYVGRSASFNAAGTWRNNAPFSAYAQEGQTNAFYMLSNTGGDFPLVNALGTYSYAEGVLTYSVAAVPEPETYGLMAGGLAMLGFMARRRSRRS